MNSKSSNDLTKGPVGKTLTRLTLPMVMGVSSSILVQLLEIGFIGQLGTDQIAAVAFTFPVTMALSSIALGIGIGVSSIVARKVGSGDWDAVKQLSSHALLLIAILIGFAATLGVFTIDPLFRLLGANEHVRAYIHDYLLIYYPGTVLFTLAMVASSVMRATGNAKIPGLLMTMTALLNLALDPIFIFGWFGFPRMELVGAAWAMFVSRSILLAMLIYYTAVREKVLSFHRNSLDGMFKSWKEIMRVGAPAIATQLISPVSGLIIVRLLASYGDTVVAGFGIASRIEATSVMFLFALSGSIGPFVGQNCGAQRFDRVKAGIKAAYQFSMAWGLLACLLLFFFAAKFVVLIDENPIAGEVAITYLLLVPLSYGFWGVLMMASASFNSLGHPLPSTFMSFTRMFVVYIPLAMLGNHYLGYQGIFVATMISNIIMGSVGYLWLRNHLKNSEVQLGA